MKSYAGPGGIALAVSALTGLAACGTERLSGKDLAAEVRTNVLAPRGITGARVRCPAETEAEKDARIRCSVADAQKNKAR